MTLPLRARAHLRALALALTLALGLLACGSGADDGAATADSDSESGSNATELPGGEDASEEGAAAGAASTDEGFDVEDWDSVLAAADGQTVNWYMFGGDEDLNAYVNGYVADELAEQGVTLNQVKVGDTVEAVNTVLAEQQAGADTDGALDAIWINGENFLTGKQADLWFCGWADQIPSAELVPWDDPAINTDFGEPVEACEAPWSRAQSILVYDSEVLPDGLESVEALWEWAEQNPGRFTYSAPPDFTGSMALRTMLYAHTGGYEDLLVDYDEATFEEKTDGFWDRMNELEASLWRGGETYPQTNAEVVDLFADDQIDAYITYQVSEVILNVEDGVYPDTARGNAFDEGGNIGNTNYVAIPFNSPNKAGAMVLTDVLHSVEAQLDKSAIGYFPVIDVEKTDQSEAFDTDSDLVPPFTELIDGAVPELSGDWINAIDDAWQERVLQQ